MMRWQWLGALALLGGGSAAAADLPARSIPLSMPAAPAYTWTGIYAGVQGGYSFDHDRTSEFFTAGRVYTGLKYDFRPDTPVGGGHLGANYQFGRIVFGVEGDIEVVDARGGFNDPGGIGRVRRDWQASARGRLGYAFDRVMVYATGGAAFSDFEYRYYNPLVRASEGPNALRVGWTVGAGVNYAVTDHVIVGLEYRRTEYDRFDYVARGPFLGLTGQQAPVMDTVRGSIAYKF